MTDKSIHLTKCFISWIIAFLFVFSLVNAAIVLLQKPNDEIIGDAELVQSSPDRNFAARPSLQSVDNSVSGMRSVIMFNINNSYLPTGINSIDEAYLYLKEDGTSDGAVLSIYEINDTWNEGDITWNFEPCGGSFSYDSKCNLTRADYALVNILNTWYKFNVTSIVRKAYFDGKRNVSMLFKTPENGRSKQGVFFSKDSAILSNYPLLNITYTLATLDATPPEIIYFNMTDEKGCENWNFNKSNSCAISSVLPTIKFTTSEPAFCSVAGGSSPNNLDKNYDVMGISRNCKEPDSGAINHVCKLAQQDELVYDYSYIFISCKDINNNQNAKSTSGPLKVLVKGLENAGRLSIDKGIQNAALSNYSLFQDLQIYARDVNNAQVRGRFDRAVKKDNKMWAFNFIGSSDSNVNMFNLSPVLYTIEFSN